MGRRRLLARKGDRELEGRDMRDLLTPKPPSEIPSCPFPPFFSNQTHPRVI